VGDGEQLLTHLNSALKVLLGLDIFRVPKKKLNFVDQCNQSRVTENTVCWLKKSNTCSKYGWMIKDTNAI